MCGKTLWILAGALGGLLCLTACAGPQPQEESTRPEVVPTQVISLQGTETPDTGNGEASPTVEIGDTEIPNQDVEFGA